VPGDQRAQHRVDAVAAQQTPAVDHVLAGVDRFGGVADIVQDRRRGQQVRVPAQNGGQVACRT
jgi:hypothetical protein